MGRRKQPFAHCFCLEYFLMKICVPFCYSKSMHFEYKAGKSTKKYPQNEREKQKPDRIMKG